VQFTRSKYAWLAFVIGVTGVVIVMVMPGGLQYFLPAKDDYPPYSPTMRKGEVFVIPANALHPTQAVVGMREVQKIIASFNNKSTDKLAARLQNANTIIIIGPGGVPYLTDGHHAVRALLDSNQENKNVYGIVLENWSAMAPADFWGKMVECGDAYLFDANHNAIDPGQLPKSVSGCTNDPYRDLAASVRVAGGYAKDFKVFYQEFIWAHYLRPLVKWDNSSDADFDRAVTEATRLAHDPAASALPGYSAVPLAAGKF